MSQRRTAVAVTGLGATTPLGGDVPSTWDGVLAGRSGVRSLAEPWAEPLAVRIAGVVAVEPASMLDPRVARTLDRTQQLALVAAREAWRDAGRPEVDGDRLGVVIASGIGGILSWLTAHTTFLERGPRKVNPYTVTMVMPSSPADVVGLELHARAGVHAPVSACASGAEAMASGLEMIRSGRADVVVAGGTEAMVHPLPLAAFTAMNALSRRNADPAAASRPYDRGRDGFVLAEGAGVLVLEAPEHAAARGARCYAQLAGAGMTSDAFHIAQPDPSGAGAARAMARALREADLGPADVGHVDAHATSTLQGDRSEATAIRTVLGRHAEAVPVSAPKSMTGHLLGAAGAVEAVITVLAIWDRCAPPTINRDDPEDVGLDVTGSDPRPLPAGDLAALSNSFGFGGHNVSLLLRSAP